MGLFSALLLFSRATVKAKREVSGEFVVSPPGRSAFSSASRRRSATAGGGSPALLRRVDSRFLFSGGIKSVVFLPENMNKCFPFCPRSGGARELAGEGVELCCLGRGCRGEGGDLLLRLLSPVPSFVDARWALASSLRVWGWCGAAPAFVVGCCCRLYRCGLSSCGGSPATTSKTTASPSARRAFEAPFLKDFRLLAFAKLPGATMAAACLQCESTAAASVFPQGSDVIFLFFRGVCTGVIS